MRIILFFISYMALNSQSQMTQNLIQLSINIIIITYQEQKQKMQQSQTLSSNLFSPTVSNQPISLIPQLLDPKNSRILTRKQIQKRLQNLQPQQYQKILTNLTNQNKTLHHEVESLHEKVNELMIAKKLPNPHLSDKRNPLLQEQVKKMKKQLGIKYQSMNYLKEEIRKAKQSQMTEQMRFKIKQGKNQVICIEAEIEKLGIEKAKIEKEIQGNMEMLEQYMPKQGRDERIQELKEENRMYRQKIQELNQNSRTTLKSSQQALQKFYNLKQQQQKFLKAILQLKISKKQPQSDLKPSKTQSQISTLEQQVNELRRLKKQTEKTLITQKMSKQSQKSTLQKKAKQNIELHKQLLQRRMKALNQLNLYETQARKQKENLQKKEQQLEKIQTQERGCQTDKIIPIDFRREWIGSSEGTPFDDSSILEYRSQILIKGVLIYRNPNLESISWIKFYYQNDSGQKKRYESKIPFDSALLRKMQSKKYMSKSDAHLTGYKLSIMGDRVRKVQFQWSDGETVAQGWDIEGSTKFVADIGEKQRPICMFGTVVFQGKNLFVLESLGCEIHKMEDE